MAQTSEHPFIKLEHLSLYVTCKFCLTRLEYDTRVAGSSILVAVKVYSDTDGDCHASGRFILVKCFIGF